MVKQEREKAIQRYKTEIVPALKDKLGIENIMAVPKLTKVVINTC